MKKYIVIGNPIEHSLSPLIHNHWIKKYKLKDSIYEKKQVETKDLKNIIDQIKNDEIRGVNITVPFKQEIIPLLDKIDRVAKVTYSVNTLYKVGNEVWGYNTDSKGFNESLIDINYKNKNIFILGAGGVTSSIIYNFINITNKIYVSNRTKKKAENLKKLYSFNDTQIEVLEWGEKPKVCDIVINTTSVGLRKNENFNFDFDEYKKNNNALFYDVIYNPKETSFLKNAKLRGNKTINGKMMFLSQAQTSFQIWTGITAEIDDEVIKLLDR
ncbi:shikimate dehydrogenase [Candidatus Pelagibacter sp.]|nr:shikimate dehydrogenase [Candidatus Pelagibacter sp.]